MNHSSSPVQPAPDNIHPPAASAVVNSEAASDSSLEKLSREEAASKALETMGSGPAFPSQDTAALPLAPTTPPPADPAAAAAIPLAADTPVAAEDNDLIEPEWVDKAKAIVERTHDDPHLQNREINKFKADYLMKRYKKQIKVNEE